MHEGVARQECQLVQLLAGKGVDDLVQGEGWFPSFLPAAFFILQALFHIGIIGEGFFVASLDVVIRLGQRDGQGEKR